MKDMTFKVEDDGVTKEYNILKYVKNPNNGKTYIIYAENGSTDAYASIYTIEKGELILDEIKTDEEWDFLDSVLEDMEDENV